MLSASWLLSGRTLMILVVVFSRVVLWLAVGVVEFDVGGIVDVEPHAQLRDLYLFFPLSGSSSTVVALSGASSSFLSSSSTFQRRRGVMRRGVR